MRSGMRVVAMWVGLIVLFVAFYGFFRPPGEPLPDLSRWIPILLVVASAVIVGVVIGKRNQKGWQLSEEGNTLLSRGRIAAALEKFETARPLLRSQGQGIIHFNIGACHLELWQLDAADRAAASVADKRLAEARAEDAEDPLIVLVNGVIACRREDWAQARALLEGPSTHVLGGPMRGLRDALLSWSVERLTGERRYVDPITVFGEASTDKLREAWPALAHFLLERARQAV